MTLQGRVGKVGELSCRELGGAQIAEGRGSLKGREQVAHHRYLSIHSAGEEVQSDRCPAPREEACLEKRGGSNTGCKQLLYICGKSKVGKLAFGPNLVCSFFFANEIFLEHRLI